jgi:hypothetical protein
VTPKAPEIRDWEWISIDLRFFPWLLERKKKKRKKKEKWMLVRV